MIDIRSFPSIFSTPIPNWALPHRRVYCVSPSFQVIPNDLTVRRVWFLLRFLFAAFRSTLMYSCQHSIFISPRFTPPGAKRNKTSEGEGGYIPRYSVGLVTGADVSFPSDDTLVEGNDQTNITPSHTTLSSSHSKIPVRQSPLPDFYALMVR